MQGDHPVRMFAPQLQAQHLAEQRVVAVPPGPERLDKRVRADQGRHDSRCPLVTSQFDGGICADMVQDACAQQNVTDLGRLDVEHLVHQIAGQRAVLGYQLLDELARVGMSAQGDRGQPEAGRPALSSPGQALQQVRRQRPAVLSQQQAGFGGAERQVASPDLGQLASQPVAVQRQQSDPSARRPPGAGRAPRCAARSQGPAAPEARSAGAGRRGSASPAGPAQRAPPQAAARNPHRRTRSRSAARNAFGMATPDRRNAATT